MKSQIADYIKRHRPAFLKAPMLKRLRIVIWIIKFEYKMVCWYTILEFISLISGIMTTIFLLLYFDSVPDFVIEMVPGPVKLNKSTAILMCLLSSSIALMTKVLQGVIDARVMSNREFWFAEYIRRLPSGSSIFRIPNRELARGSHYFGRLSSTVLQITASGTLFIVTYLFCLSLLRGLALVLAIAGSFLLLPIALGLILFIGRRLKNSAKGLVDNASEVALWKANKETKTSQFVSDYYSMYFYRIFLVGLFGYANLLFAFCFMLLLLINQAADMFLITFETVFMFYFIAQIYLGTFARFATNIVKTAAFLPFVEPVMDV